ncbi:MAG: hypothetical protein RIQ41_503 [Candidatus Parcubacteria bacterium]|jgi:hypothetical protein
MIYTLVGTHGAKREQALVEIAKLGSPSAHLYGEHIHALLPLIEAGSLFGEKVIVHIIQTLEKAETREYVYDLLQDMQSSANIFVIDEPFADANRMKKLEKVSHKLFDAREEKEETLSPFGLCNAVARKDKKGAWVEWMKIQHVLEPEAIQGALWWKISTLWGDTLSGKPTKFSIRECEALGKRVMSSSVLAHRGEKDLKVELESIVLSI